MSRRTEGGQVSVLIIGFFVVALLLVVVVVDASAAYLHRQRLDAVADGAAIAAVDGVQEASIYEQGLGQRAVLDPAQARALVAEYVRGVGAARYAGLHYQVFTTPDSVTVVVSAPLSLPLAPPGWGGTTRVTASAAAFTEVVG
ncbi:MAG: hypothetical protein QOK15_3259 [Nocardioidaceae bacterium]|nr:hypothetical protein [Nocardioidaceae bacterium]